MLKALIAALAVASMEAPEPLSRVVDYEHSISPDGQRVAFVSNRDGRFKLYVMARDGSGIVRLTDDAGVDDNPAWSPDGTRIAFVSEIDGNSDVYVVNADGSGRVRLTTDPGYDIHPAWSPDGQRLLFNSLRRANAPEHIDVFEINSSGGPERQITRDVSGSYASWSPDGRVILLRAMFSANSDIALMSPRGRIIARLTTDPAFEGWPAWSPDGAHIVFARERGDAEDQADIFVMDADGANQRLIAGEPGRKTNPRWSSDGAIVYSRNFERQVRLWRMRAPD